jgi:hypothetical protein
MKCKREQQVIVATQNGVWTPSLRAHVHDCALCNHVQLIAASLQEYATAPQPHRNLPAASMIWRRAQTRRRVDALQRTTRRPFLVVGVLSALYSLVLLLWGLFHLPQSVYRLFVTPSGLTGEVAFAAAALSGILVVLGSFVLVLETRR